MKFYLKLAGATVVGALALPTVAAVAQVPKETVRSLGAPDTAQTRIGTLEFKDGAPTAETARKVYDTLDFTRALNVYNNSFRGASALAIVKGFESLGVKPGDVAIFSELMDSSSLFLTANADGISSAGLAVEQGDFTEYIAAAQEVDRHLLAEIIHCPDTDQPPSNGIKPVTRSALEKQDLPRGQMPLPADCRDLLERVTFESRKERIRTQNTDGAMRGIAHRSPLDLDRTTAAFALQHIDQKAGTEQKPRRQAISSVCDHKRPSANRIDHAEWLGRPQHTPATISSRAATRDHVKTCPLPVHMTRVAWKPPP